MLTRFLHHSYNIVRYAALGLRQSAAVHSLSVGIIGLSLTALGAFGVIVFNVSRLAQSWGRELTVTAFLKPQQETVEVTHFVQNASEQAGVLHAHFVSQQEARLRLFSALGDKAGMLSGVDDRVIPSAVEVELAPGTAVEQGAQVALWLKSSPLVEDVSYGAEEMSRLSAVVSIMRVASALLGALLALVTVLVISNTLKLTVLARREEIEIMKLVGASDAFVRAPFLLEGAVQGLLGALLAGGSLLALQQSVAPQVEATLSAAFGPISLGGPPWEAVAALAVLGTLLGLLGGLVGVSRFLKV